MLHYIAPGKPQRNAFIESFNAGCAMPRSAPPDRLESRLRQRPTAQRARQSTVRRCAGITFRMKNQVFHPRWIGRGAQVKSIEVGPVFAQIA